jgi:capping protein beta
LPDGATPNATLRKLEVHANEAFDTYREMYYEGGVSSVYTFEIEDKFAVVVLIKKGKDSSQIFGHISRSERLYFAY